MMLSRSGVIGRGFRAAVVALTAALLVTGSTLPAMAASSADGGAAAAGAGPYAIEEILVMFRPGAAVGRVTASVHATGASVVSSRLSIQRLRLPGGTDVASALARLRQDPAVLLASPNYRAIPLEWVRGGTAYGGRPLALAAPNDPAFADQWWLSNPLTGIRWSEVYDYVYNAHPPAPADPVIVAVVDSGVDYYHPDLAGRVLAPGYDAVTGAADGMDILGHGTHVAGIIAATVDNGVGVAAVAGMVYARILPVRVFNAQGLSTMADIIRGIEYAADEGADVINLSLGLVDGANNPVQDPILETAVGYAQSKGALVVAAAGNAGSGVISSPANYAGVIAVGATMDTAPWRADFSDYGPELDVVAPGVNIISPCPDSLADCTPGSLYSTGYHYMSGTSMATPVAAGVATVLKAVYSNYTAFDLGALLLSTADDLTSSGQYAGWDPYTGRGMVDAWSALTTAPPVVAGLLTPDAGATVTGVTTVSLRVYVPELFKTVSFHLDSATAAPVASVDLGAVLNANPTAAAHQYLDVRFDWNPSSALNGDHTLIAKLANLGAYTTVSRPVTLNVAAAPAPGGGGGGGGGEPGVPRVQAKVGPNGGTVTGFDGVVEVRFPAGSFDREVDFTVSERPGAAETDTPDIKPVSAVFEFDTGGVVPQKPVTVTLRYDKERLGAADVRTLALYRQDDQDPAKWIYVGGRVDAAAGVVHTQLAHFSRYAVMAYAPTFPDLSGHWARREVELLAARHVVAGGGDGAFGPDRGVTRAEMAKMLVGMLGHDPGRMIDEAAPGTPTFSDVAPDAWYFKYVETAAKLGLVRGDGGRFRPDDRVRREEMAAMVVRVLGLEATAQSLTGAPLGFADAADVAPWARGYVAVARDRGLIRGLTPTTFGPQAGSSRAQTAVVILRAMERAAWLQVPSVVEGTLAVNDIEGRHYELETLVDGKRQIYVLVPLGDDLERTLAANVGKTVRVTGLPHQGADIHMRGPVLRVTDVQVMGP